MLCYLIKPSTMTAEDMETPECMKRIQVQVCERRDRSTSSQESAPTASSARNVLSSVTEAASGPVTLSHLPPPEPVRLYLAQPQPVYLLLPSLQPWVGQLNSQGRVSHRSHSQRLAVSPSSEFLRDFLQC